MYYAHIRDDGAVQTVEEHLKSTAQLCGSFAKPFGEEDRGKLLGYAHDIGKCSEAFQKRLHGGAKVDHATAGALECAKLGENALACCVVGHHGGLPDFGNPKTDYPGMPTCAGRIKKGMVGGIPAYHWAGVLPKPGKQPAITDPYALSMWVRMLYSCLVDADYLDTEAFMSNKAPQRGGYDPLPVLLERLRSYIAPWFPGNTELNRNRCAILSQCLEKASQPRGIYSLTVPTGGGKTVSSLAFALKHAVENGMDRVIYVIPYTSIIEQNAAVFREIVGERNVVEHHSGVRYDDDDETNKANRFQRLAAENWDAPVIVTTAVQFFESLHSNRSSQCRKLHNLANSVVIFDEAQMLPTCHLLPCVGAMANLVSQFRATVLLCTATQPVLGDLFHRFCPDQQITELCPDVAENFRNFRRVTYRDGGTLSDEALAGELCREKQVLCIVNTRKAAQTLYSLLPEEGRFHLSTLLYPAHRKAVLETIRGRLKAGLPCRVVSTSLIEAGVDVDFPTVYREIAGLDSIAQAAGRCNREGKRDASASVVTYFQNEHPIPVLQRVNLQAAREALQQGGNPGDPATMRQYFTALRSWIGENMDKSGMMKTLQEQSLPFKTVSEAFHLIEEDTFSVYIPLGDGESACRPLSEGRANREDYRRAGQYSVSIYEQHFRDLLNSGDLLPLSDGSAILTNLRLYDPEMGLSLKSDAGRADFI
ncbi:MAG: CRISPR-associated helicase Cas3' [Candidatus Faecousia sp.]|nr:CRISPR-associated helicase Cas3' [Candidatus Faecousia sp.]